MVLVWAAHCSPVPSAGSGAAFHQSSPGPYTGHCSLRGDPVTKQQPWRPCNIVTRQECNKTTCPRHPTLCWWRWHSPVSDVDWQIIKISVRHQQHCRSPNIEQYRFTLLSILSNTWLSSLLCRFPVWELPRPLPARVQPREPRVHRRQRHVRRAQVRGEQNLQPSHSHIYIYVFNLL